MTFFFAIPFRAVGDAWGDMNPVDNLSISTESTSNNNLFGNIRSPYRTIEDDTSIVNDSELQNESENQLANSLTSELVMDSEDQFNAPDELFFEDDEGDLPSTNELMQIFGINNL